MAALNIGPATLDLSGVRGGDKNAIFVTITSSGAPYDLTGYTVAAQARSKADDPTAAIDGVIDNISPTAGTFTLRWPGAEVSALFAPGETSWSGVWDLQILAVPDDPITVCAGTFAATLDVTRP